MAKTLWRLGSLGVFVAMAGVSWLVEACTGKSVEAPRGGDGGQGGVTGANTLTTGGENSSASGTTTGGSTATGGATGTASGGTRSSATTRQNTGGLHDVPCE